VKILIMGATGNLAALTARTVAQNHPEAELRLASHREAGRSALAAAFPRAEIVYSDWYDEASVRVAVTGVDKVLIVTPDFVTDEAVATQNFIQAMREGGTASLVLRFIAIPPGFTIDRLMPAQLATRAGAALHLVAKPLLDASKLPVCYVNAACWIMFNLAWFIAADVKASRRFIMPSATDAHRQWIAESDLAELFAKILTDDARPHVGREYLVTGGPRYTYAQVANLIGNVLDAAVTYVDSDEGLRRTMGRDFDALMTYFSHEVHAYSSVPATQTLERLLGRPRLSLREYVEQHRYLFL
jgi:uncharacterized protein YbjT (DUF2867 family)